MADQNSDHGIHPDDYHAILIKCDDIDLLKKSGLLNKDSSFECIKDYYLHHSPFAQTNTIHPFKYYYHAKSGCKHKKMKSGIPHPRGLRF